MGNVAMSIQSTPVIRTAPQKIDATAREVQAASGGASIKVAWGRIGAPEDLIAPLEASSLPGQTLSFDAVIWNGGGFTWNANSRDRLVCVRAGVYLFQAQVASFYGEAGEQEIAIIVRRQSEASGIFYGLDVEAGRTYDTVVVTNGMASGQAFGILPCNVNDYVRLRWGHTAPSGRYLGNQDTWFSATLISDYVNPVDPSPEM